MIRRKHVGVAVDLAKNLSDDFKDGDIIVSRTGKDLVAGSGIRIKEQTETSFTEIDGRWKSFAVTN